MMRDIYVHLVVDLEAGDGEHDDHKEGGGAQLRQGDVPELLPAVCTVQLGGFVQVRVAALQAGQIDDHVVAHVLPHAEQDDRDHGGVLTGSPAGQVFHRHAKELVQNHVDGAHGGVEDHVPHRCHRHQRGNIGEERHGAEEVAQLHVLVQQHSHGQRAGQRQRHRANDVDDGVFQSRLKNFIGGEELYKVFQADKLDGVAAVPCAEGQRNGKHHRHQRKHAEADEVWRNEGIRDQRIAGRFF